ncbi:MAG: penicillin-binding protein 2 [Verrucomicrobiota bacterium]
MLIESPNIHAEGRLRVLSIVLILVVIYLIFRLYEVQISEGSKYAERLRSQITVPVRLSPARGSIMDRNGLPLAENKASFDIDVYLREIVGNYSRTHKGKLPKTNINIGIGKARRSKNIVDADKILAETAGEILEALSLDKSFTRKQLLTHYNQTPDIPFQLAHNIEFNTLSQFTERSLGISGIQEAARPVRQYNYGALASHILGYVGKFEGTPEGNDTPEIVGKKGIERTFDQYLQGQPGSRILRKNNKGYILGVESEMEPKIGGTVYLTLDARIQQIVEQAMRPVGRGACVVMNVWTGDILAMASVPNFDPNVFIPAVDSETWDRLTRDSTKPLHDRSISHYATGSTFKTVVALAALKNKTITPTTTIFSPRAVYIAGRNWHDWYEGDRGDINLKTAMQWSCNTFFYQLGVKTGIDSIVNMGKTFGFGENMLQTIDGQLVLPTEQSGLMPSPQWMKDRANRHLAAWKKRRAEDPNYKARRPGITYERWSNGHTCNTSIGQGFVAITPLQLTTMMCAVANGGTVYFPRLVRGVTRLDKKGNTELIKEYPVVKRADMNINESDMKAIHDSLRAVVTSGTGKKAGVDGFPVCGKTGTAQFMTTLNGRRVKDNRAWFNGFAPYDNPRYAITVIVEGGKGGGSTAGPIVHKVMKGIYEMEVGGSIDMVYLTPAVGHYSGVLEVSSDSSIEEDSAPVDNVITTDLDAALLEQQEQNVNRTQRRDPRSTNRRVGSRNWRFDDEEDDE